MDRHTVAGTAAFAESPADEYLESNCADDPVKLCDFQLLENRIMKTVDSVYQDVPTMEACRDLCLSAPYRCHSFDYGDTGQRVCRLSHHTSTTLTQIQEPFLVIQDVVGTYELGSCYNVTIDCRAADMVATVRTNKIFEGKIYAKDNPNSCVVDVEAGIEFSIKMGYNDIECNVKRSGSGSYSSEVIIQHHDSVVTSQDLGLALNCQYDLSNKTVVNDFDLAIDGEIEPSLFQEAVVESPNVFMQVYRRRGDGEAGDDVKSAQVGDPLELRFEIFGAEDSPYDIFVRDLIAKDGNDQTQIVLLDSSGCPTEGRIMGPLRRRTPDEGSKVLAADFDAFKFPTSEVVQFRAHVTPCIPACAPVTCPVHAAGSGSGAEPNPEADGGSDSLLSYGRKKRSVNDYWSTLTGSKGRNKRSVSPMEGQKVLVTQDFVVVDKFSKVNHNGPKSQGGDAGRSLPGPGPRSPPESDLQAGSQGRRDALGKYGGNMMGSTSFESSSRFEEGRHPEEDGHSPHKKSTASEVCLNSTGIAVAVLVFLALQVLVVALWTLFWQRRLRSKQKQKSEAVDAFVSASATVFNPYTLK